MLFTVKRDNWRCGDGHDSHGHGRTALLNDEGYRCCIGFVCQQLGVSDNEMREVDAVKVLDEAVKLKHVASLISDRTDPHCGVREELPFIKQAYLINDDNEDESGRHRHIRSRAEREKALSELFALHGHEMQFTGCYED